VNDVKRTDPFVLLVEDDRDWRIVFKHYAETAFPDVIVHCVRTVHDAIAFLRTGRYCMCVVVDYELQGMRGDAVLAALAFMDVPVAIWTAHSKAHLREMGHCSYGDDECLVFEKGNDDKRFMEWLSHVGKEQTSKCLIARPKQP